MSEDDLNDEAAPGIDEVERRLNEIQVRKRNRVRWRMSKHTAELALSALDRKRSKPRPSPKSRRRKRWKRLL